ncbi:hypothetical protein [Caballeronia sp. LZ001]|uniref:hypothetical protein n=1 Tax=Caballeronia sp. LZ001 TaxID=3038553 RepID=UPI002865DF3F|nr:hypothetical protein [Caballeronia sp. LZ001]MDR5800598.1 hypothetical protein [Caballeronia sp. LZ001]
MKNATVIIEASRKGSSSKGRVVIYGQLIPGVEPVKTLSTVDEQPIVTFELQLLQNIKIENASIVVDDAIMPEGVEQALREYFVAKYAPSPSTPRGPIETGLCD